MRYLADSVALIRHLRKHRRLGLKARKILQEADAGEHSRFKFLLPQKLEPRILFLYQP